MNKNRKLNFNLEYQKFFKTPNWELIEILYSRNKYSILREDHIAIKINTRKRKLEFLQIYLYLQIVKNGNINPIEIIEVYDNFSDYIDSILSKNIDEKHKNDFEIKIINLILCLRNINTKISSILYSYIFSFEKTLII
ncbi:MAG: hypothetical protein HPPSJP_1970 [Candidatus Hepatoplasma scabrum]|nr:MAG: hypothetical protein HPPSJP_1970 [Candidatus Hepatoplasma sp.]